MYEVTRLTFEKGKLFYYTVIEADEYTKQEGTAGKQRIRKGGREGCKMRMPKGMRLWKRKESK